MSLGASLAQRLHHKLGTTAPALSWGGSNRGRCLAFLYIFLFLFDHLTFISQRNSAQRQNVKAIYLPRKVNRVTYIVSIGLRIIKLNKRISRQ